MADLQIKGNKIALIDSNDNIVYMLPDSAGALGKALISDGAGKLFYGGINIDSVLATGNTTTRNINVDTLTVNTLNTSRLDNQQSQAFSFQGSTSGYASGGIKAAGFTGLDTIDKFPFSSDANATDVGNLTVARYGSAGQSSSTHGYTSAGAAPQPTQPPFQNYGTNIIDKFSFASDANATDVGGMRDFRTYYASGTSSATNGYIVPGEEGNQRFIEKFPFAADNSSSEVSFLAAPRTAGTGGHSSDTHGYVSGGRSYPGSGNVNYRDPINEIVKFSMVVDTLVSDVGDLTVETSTHSAQSSTSHGYVSAGISSPPVYTHMTKIEKFSFSVDGNGVLVGDLSQALGSHTAQASGQSSTTHGYHSGGGPSWTDPIAILIQKFPFSTDANATEVGDLTEGRSNSAGQQV